MKKFLKTLLALTLVTAFLLTGCDTTDVIIDAESIRTFCLSKEAATLSIEKSESDALASELCAIYNDTATFKLTYPDNSVMFYTFRVLTDAGFSLKPLSNRAFTAFENGCEFFPREEDGYTESAFIPCGYNDIFSSVTPGPLKIRFYIPETGSGQTYTNEVFLDKFTDAISKIKLLPIERFITTNETLLEIEFAGSVIEFYDSKEAEIPSCSIILNMLCLKTASQTSRIYFPNDISPVTDTYLDTLAEIKDGNQLP